MTDHKPMRIMRYYRATGPHLMPEGLPWDIIEPHEHQALRNHGQSLERLNERGGLEVSEAVAILEDRQWHAMPEAKAFARLAELVAAATARLP